MEISGSLKLFISIFLLLSLQNSFAQGNKIIKIHDSNLFELNDGRIIKMAGIDSPRKDHPSRHMAELSKKMIEYSEKVLKGREYKIIPASGSLIVPLPGDSSSYMPAYIIKHYPAGSEDINKLFLLMGFGRFTDNVDSLHREVYLRAEKDAAEHEKGIWQYRTIGIKDTLDRAFTHGEAENYASVDSMHLKLVYLDRLAEEIPLAGKISSEILVGAGIGTAGMISFGILGGFMGGGFSAGGTNGGAFGGVVLGGYAGYLIGSSLGVYIIAKRFNPEVTYLGTFASGLAGAAVGLGINSLMKEQNAFSLILATLSAPLIGSVIYANSVSPPLDWPTGEDTFRQDFSTYGSIAFKDYRNRENVINIRLASIPF